VGLAGRPDATNVVEPLVSVITSVSYDHMNVLGHSLTAIAGEKAGIIKPGRPVVVSPQKEETLEVIEAVAEQRGSALTLVGRDLRFAGLVQSRSLDGQALYVWNADQQALMDGFLEGQTGWRPLELRLALLGEHQVQNAATAYAALSEARRQGLRVDDEAIAIGFAAARWPGRFELLRREPPVVLDSAHNRDSALRLRLALDDYFPNCPVVMLFGVSADKDVAGMFTELMPRAGFVVATQAGTQRAMAAEELVALAHRFGRPAQARQQVEPALSLALDWAEQEQALLLITGSIFLVADAWRAWQQR
jgi:dihydrofolate synthase/folylpolyglutamate synthase